MFFFCCCFFLSNYALYIWLSDWRVLIAGGRSVGRVRGRVRGWAVQVRGRRCAPYVRELSEVGGVDVEPLRQPLHEVQALVAGEGAVERARHNTEQVGVRLTHTRPLKRLSFLFYSFAFSPSLWEELPHFLQPQTE